MTSIQCSFSAPAFLEQDRVLEDRARAQQELKEEEKRMEGIIARVVANPPPQPNTRAIELRLTIANAMGEIDSDSDSDDDSEQHNEFVTTRARMNCVLVAVISIATIVLAGGILAISRIYS